MAPASTVLNGEQIQARLRKFVKDWQTYDGTERSEAQTFLNELFAAYGGDRRATAFAKPGECGRSVGHGLLTIPVSA